jgi:hypothetical protein
VLSNDENALGQLWIIPIVRSNLPEATAMLPNSEELGASSRIISIVPVENGSNSRIVIVLLTAAVLLDYQIEVRWGIGGGGGLHSVGLLVTPRFVPFCLYVLPCPFRQLPTHSCGAASCSTVPNLLSCLS